MLDSTIIVDTPSTPKITPNYNKFIAREVLAAIRSDHPMISVADYTASFIVAYIPEDADTGYWLKELRNVSKPKVVKPKRKRSGEPKRKSSRTAAIAFGKLRAAGVAL